MRSHGRKLFFEKKILLVQNLTAPSWPPPPPSQWVMPALHNHPFVLLCWWGGGRWAEWCAYPSEPARLHLWDGPLRLKQLLHPTPTAACQSSSCGIYQGQGQKPASATNILMPTHEHGVSWTAKCYEPRRRVKGQCLLRISAPFPSWPIMLL